MTTADIPGYCWQITEPLSLGERYREMNDGREMEKHKVESPTVTKHVEEKRSSSLERWL